MYRCPKCGCDDLRVEMIQVCVLEPDGTAGEPVTDAHVPTDALACCTNEDCEWSAELTAFHCAEVSK